MRENAVSWLLNIQFYDIKACIKEYRDIFILFLKNFVLPTSFDCPFKLYENQPFAWLNFIYIVLKLAIAKSQMWNVRIDCIKTILRIILNFCDFSVLSLLNLFGGRFKCSAKSKSLWFAEFLYLSRVLQYLVDYDLESKVL